MKEKFTYPVGIKVFAFMLTGFCAAVRFGTAENLILPVTLAVGLQAGIVLFLEKEGIHLYYQRFFGVFIPSIIVLALYGSMGWDADLMPVFMAIYMAIACGTLIVDGLINIKKESGRKNFVKAVVIGMLHGSASLLAMTIREVLWI